MTDNEIKTLHPSQADYVINPEKSELITVDDQRYHRLCIKTHVITDKDNLADVVEKYAVPLLQQGDILFITEKAVACVQHRAFPLEDIHPTPLALLLSKFVIKTPHGIGLGMPETMEMALQECGTIRILAAAAVSVVGKAVHRHGLFYKVAGYQASSIDGPCHFTLPPYNHYVVLGPNEPDKVAAEISSQIGKRVIITDINDLGGNILGVSDQHMDRSLLCRILKDNPLGQSSEQTPLGIIRLDKRRNSYSSLQSTQ